MQRLRVLMCLAAVLYGAVAALVTPARAQTEENEAPHIAALLPLKSHTFLRYAEAVRRGIAAAATAEVDRPNALPVVVYPTGDDPKEVVDTYDLAIRRGARFVIGPLTKSAVQAVATSYAVSVPTLALSVPEGEVLLPDGMYAFGMQMEAEARQVARVAQSTGKRRVAIFVADNASGAGYFKNFGRTRRQGLEAGLNTRVGPATLGFNYTYLQATYRSAETIDGSSNSSNDAAAGGFPGVDGTIDIRPGDRIAGQPRQMVKLFGDLALGESFSIGADLAAFSGALARGNENGQHQPDGVYYLGPGRNPGYAVLNFNAEYKPTAGLKFFTQVENVFDRRYTTAAQLGATGFDNNGNFLARPFPADANGDRPLRQSTFFAPGAPRTFWVGLRMTFGG